MQRVDLRAKTEEELAELEEMGVPEVREAIDAYRHITVTPEFQEAERLRSKARHDEAQAVYNAERRGRQDEKFEIAKNLMRDGDSIDRIVRMTGLTREEVEGLRQ
jgi:predicted transposase/invertase (TIGR01784 family)